MKKFLVYTDKIVSIQWLNPVPRQQICECFEIPLLHSEPCDLLLLRYCFASAFPARSPRNLGSLTYFVISVFGKMSINTMFPGCHFRRSFRIWILKKWLRVLALLYVRDYLWTPLTVLGDLAIDNSLLDCCPSFNFLFWFLLDRLGFPTLERAYRHFVVLLDSYPMCPAVPM